MSSPTAPGWVDGRAPVRVTYGNLYRWPESDAEFVKSVRSGAQRRLHHGQQQHQPPVVDSYSCRQMYLRSYAFSRKETVPERTRKCLGGVKAKVKGWLCRGGGGAGAGVVGMVHVGGRAGKKKKNKKKQNCLVTRRLREVSSAALRSLSFLIPHFLPRLTCMHLDVQETQAALGGIFPLFIQCCLKN